MISRMRSVKSAAKDYGIPARTLKRQIVKRLTEENFPVVIVKA